MNNSLVLEARDVSKIFVGPENLTLFSNINCTLHREESIAILGKSGEGKTTLLHVLATLDTPSSGTIKILGEDTRTANTNLIRNSHIGFVFQSFHLMPHDTVLENALLPAKIARKDTSIESPTYEKAKALLSRVGLSGKEKLLAKKLSGGEKQRLALVRALINDPEILFADEPTGNLDHKTAREIEDLLLLVVKEEKKALILVTHSQEFALRCDHHFILDDGKLIKTTL